MKYLRQNTATIVSEGPFLDPDGVTLKTALTITPAQRKLSKVGGTLAATSDGSNAAHDADGDYQFTLTATDLNTPGRLKLRINATGALPYVAHYTVLTAQAYDAQFVHPLIGQAIGYGQLQGGGSFAATLWASASSVDEMYTGRLLVPYDGTGAGEVGYIEAYAGSTRGCIMAEEWPITVDATTKAVILPCPKLVTLPQMTSAVGSQQLSGALHAPNVRPTRDQALLYIERFLSNLVQASGTVDNVKDVDGSTNLASITYSPDNSAPTSRTRTA